MSRKGKSPVLLPKGVEVSVQQEVVTVKGPKGVLQQVIKPGFIIEIKEGVLNIREDELVRPGSNFHGLYRSLINNMVVGVSVGFEKKLEMIGVGYKAAVQGTLLDVAVGFSHPTKMPIPAGIEVSVEKNVNIFIKGIDKQAVGQFAATVRALRKPEPYKGKGIRYSGEYVRRKAGKSGKTSKK